MPNWCTTTIILVPRDDSKESQNALNNVTEKLTTYMDKGKQYVKSDFGIGWLGNISVLFGLRDAATLDYDTHEGISTGYGYRGSITDVETYDSENLYIQQEDAWVPNVKMWVAIIEKNYLDENGEPLIDIYFEGHEPGNCINITNDTDRIYCKDEIYVSLSFANLTKDSPLTVIDKEKSTDDEIVYHEKILDKYPDFITSCDSNYIDINISLDGRCYDKIIEFFNDILDADISSMDDVIAFIDENDDIVDQFFMDEPLTDASIDECN